MFGYFSKRLRLQTKKYSISLNDIGGFEKTCLQKVFFPRTIENFQTILKKAKFEKKSICIRGTNHTMGGHTLLDDGFLLDMKFCNQIFYNENTKRVTVETGAHWSDVIRTLNAYGRSPIVLQSYCSFSVGGTISVNAHGISSDKTISESIVSMKIITHNGEILTCSRKENQELFSLAIGGYGLFGIIYSVELETTENKKLDLEVISLKRDELIEPYKKILQDENVNIKIVRFNITDFDKSTAYIFRENSQNSIISQLSYKPRHSGILSKLFYKWIVPTSIFQTLRFKLENYFQQPLDFNKYKDRNQILYEDASQYSSLISPLIKVNDTFILQEYFVPEENLISWWKEFENLNKLKDQKITLLNTTLRYVKQDKDTFLKYAPKDSFAIVLYFRICNTKEMDEKLGDFQQKMIHMTLGKNGTFYLPYRKYYSENDLISSYPQWKDFIMLKRKYDPFNLFSNRWIQHYSKEEISLNEIETNLVNEPSRIDIKERVNNHDSFIKIFHSNNQFLRNDFEEFVNNVFNISKPSFLKSLIQASIVKSNSNHDHEIYEKLQIEYQKFSWILNLKLVSALSKSRNQIGGELLEAIKYLGIENDIRAYASVGDPGKLNYFLKKNLPRLEKNLIIHDNYNRFSTILESGGIFFNHEFVQFDYENIKSHEELKLTESLDLITCNMGLHHFSPQNRDKFLNLVFNSLRDGGLFVIREHDANDELVPLLDMAHIVFNAALKVPIKDEKAEIRDFKPINHWIQILKDFGFEDTMIYNQQDDDPTKDIMIIVRKPGILDSTQKSAQKDIKWFERSDIDAWFVPSEIQIVQSMQNLGFMMNNDPWYRYPFFKDVVKFHQSFYHFTKDSVKRNGLLNTIKTNRFFAILIAIELTSVIFMQMQLIALPFLLMFGKQYGDNNVMKLIVRSKFKLEDLKDCQIKILEGESYEITSPRYTGFLTTLKSLSEMNHVKIETINYSKGVIFVGLYINEDIHKFNFKHPELFNFKISKVFNDKKSWIIFELKPEELLNWIKLTKDFQIEIYDP